MSLRYKGARLSATPPTTVGGTTAGANAAPGIWTLDQQMKAQGQSAWPGAGNWIEDVFSTYLYTGNSSTQTITNDINLSGQGGLVWIKDRTNVADHRLIDTVTGAQKELISNQTTAQVARTTGLTAFNNNGFSLGSASGYNTSATNYVSWAFREQSKFFDVVTYTGNGIARTIPHNLGSVPGCIIVKVTSAAGNWWVYHRSLTNAQYLVLNTTAAVASGSLWNSTTPTATEFSIGATSDINNSGATYVAYLFAHDAGGFGAAGTDNVISCGSYTGNGQNNAVVTLGYEAQFVMVKKTNDVADWYIQDNMRGANEAANATLFANTSAAEVSNQPYICPVATGFRRNNSSALNGTGDTYIYIAIRRGPMKTPTLGTTVFGLNARSGTSSNVTVTGGQIADHFFVKNRGLAIAGLWTSRLVGANYAEPSSTAAFTPSGATQLQSNPWDVMDGVKVGTTGNQTNSNSYTYINYMFRRAPGFFDVVCYTGDGVAGRTVSHNLGVTPEMIIIKKRSSVDGWFVCNANYTNKNTYYQRLNTTAAQADYGGNLVYNWGSTTFALDSANVNDNTSTYVAYLFATLAGVSKVGSYTGTGTTQQVNCGFTSGARFILIKRTDSTGDWYYWDTARGIVAGNDPYLLLNNTNTEVTSTDYVDTFSSGFELSSTAPADLNEAPGITWVSRTSGFGADNIFCAAYGNGLYVAGGTTGKLFTSTDGVTWTSRTSNFGTETVLSIVYGNGLFVAVGGTGKLSTSTDGITWTSRTSGFGTSFIRGVTYGNGVFVAVGDAGKITTSTDGITWTSRTSNFGSTSINGVVYGNGVYVAVGDLGKMDTSTDAVTWTSRTSGFGTQSIRAVTYGNNLFVAVGGNAVMTTSSDGTTWTSRTSGFGGTTNILGVAYGNGIYVAVGGSGTMTTSSDAISWTSRTSGFGATQINGVGYGNGLFVAVGQSGTMTTNNPNYIFLAIA